MLVRLSTKLSLTQEFKGNRRRWETMAKKDGIVLNGWNGV